MFNINSFYRTEVLKIALFVLFLRKRLGQKLGQDSKNLFSVTKPKWDKIQNHTNNYQKTSSKSLS